jgi:class 3 adenylate cyclase
MRSNYRAYDHVASAGRMAEILDQPGVSYEERDSLPSRESLTFSNGYYANCSAIFIDIRESSFLPNKYKRPKLARLYRAFLSEAIAVMNGDANCREINVVGDGAWSVINTPYTKDIDRAFGTVYALNSMVQILNHQTRSRGFDPIRVGIGASWGRALMVKAGLSGSAINDIVYMGDVVNQAAKLAAYGSTGMFVAPIHVSAVFHDNLNEHNQGLLNRDWQRGHYYGDVVNTGMQEWLEDQRSG